MSEIQNRLVKSKDECSACGLCYSICPVNAIDMLADEEGFIFPHIDENKCIKCKKCISSCTYTHYSEMNIPTKTYAVKAVDNDVYLKAASGGVFGTIATKFVEDGYVVGAILENSIKLDVHHHITNNSSEVSLIQGSKYVQSSSFKSFAQIQNLLKKGEKVLFSGTPCQVDAIKKFTGNPDNLFTIDLICHGVPSVLMLEDFIKIISKTLHIKIDNIVFRDKTISKPYCSCITSRSGKKYYVISELLSFYKYFLSGEIFRDNCYCCKYARSERCGDITIGDYWGIEKYHPEIATKGQFWSCVLLNTEKGISLFAQNIDSFLLIPTEYEWIKENNSQLNRPIDKPYNRNILVKQYAENGYRMIEKNYRKKRKGNIHYIKQLISEIVKNRYL